MYGAGSNENRLNGSKNDSWARAHKCIQCGHYIDIPPDVMPMSEALKHPTHAQSMTIAKEKNLEVGIDKIPRASSIAMTKFVVEQFEKSISNEVKNGTSWESITKLIVLASKTPVKKHILKKVWEERK
jgi:hypothetical protein